MPAPYMHPNSAWPQLQVPPLTCCLVWWVAPASAQPDVKTPVPCGKGLTARDATRYPSQTGVQHTCVCAKSVRGYRGE